MLAQPVHLQIPPRALAWPNKTCALVLGLLYSMTYKGTRECYAMDKTIEATLHLSHNCVDKAMRFLSDSGIAVYTLKGVRTPAGFYRRRYVSLNLGHEVFMEKGEPHGEGLTPRNGVPVNPTEWGSGEPHGVGPHKRDLKNKDLKGCVPHSPDGGAGTHSDPPSAPSQEEVEQAVAAYVRSTECRKPDAWKTEEAVKRIAVTVLNNIVQKGVKVRNLDLYVKDAVENWKGIERAMAPKPKPRKAKGGDAGGAFGSVSGGNLRGSMEEATDSAMDAIQILEGSCNDGGGGSLPKLAAAQAGTGTFLL